MKRLYVLLLKKLRLLFDFYQPRFRHLDCIDLVLENKLLLLLSWDTIHSSKICIHPGNITYRTSISAAICRLPAGTDRVDITLHNLWRSRKESFTLKRITIDQQTLSYLDELFIARLTLFISQPVISFPGIELKQFNLILISAIPAPAINISINKHQLNDYAP